MNELELKVRAIEAEMREKKSRDGAHGHLYANIETLLHYIQYLRLQIAQLRTKPEIK